MFLYIDFVSCKKCICKSVYSKNILVESIGSFKFRVMPSANRNHLISSFPNERLRYLSLDTLFQERLRVKRTGTTVLPQTLEFLPFIIMLVLEFLYTAFVLLKHMFHLPLISSGPLSWRHAELWKMPLLYWDVHTISALKFYSYEHYIFELCIVKQPCILKMKLPWSWCLILTQSWI